ncbi:MAG: GNAT family N-acetyltransferase [Actinobacteria bacterium]|nr:GNAT family N-acetyltransferase [Actinomycetota bacterium]
MTEVAAIRFAMPEEREALRGVHRRSAMVWEEDRRKLEAHPEVFGVSSAAIAAGRVRVAVDGAGKVLGFSVVADVGEGVCELDDLFVEPGALRGGVGTALVEDAAARHRAAGFREMAVTAAARTFGFYESLGFEVGEPVRTRFGPAARLRRSLTVSDGGG